MFLQPSHIKAEIEGMQKLQNVLIAGNHDNASFKNLPTLFMLEVVYCISHMLEVEQLLSDSDEKELPGEVCQLAADAITLLRAVNGTGSAAHQALRYKTEETFDWFEHLLNTIDPKLGNMFCRMTMQWMIHFSQQNKNSTERQSLNIKN